MGFFVLTWRICSDTQTHSWQRQQPGRARRCQCEEKKRISAGLSQAHSNTRNGKVKNMGLFFFFTLLDWCANRNNQSGTFGILHFMLHWWLLRPNVSDFFNLFARLLSKIGSNNTDKVVEISETTGWDSGIHLDWSPVARSASTSGWTESLTSGSEGQQESAAPR